MPDSIPENICFILDASRSMFKNDYKPNRIEACKNGIIHFIDTYPKKDRVINFSLIIAGNTVKIAFDLEDSLKNPDLLNKYIKNIELGGNSKIGDAILSAIKLLVEDIRKSTVKKSRGIVLSDGINDLSKEAINKIGNISTSLNIVFDGINIGEFNPSSKIKYISEITGGISYFCNDSNSILTTMNMLAKANFQNRQSVIYDPITLLDKIAAPLRTESELDKNYSDIVARIRKTANYKKCGICFKEKCESCKNNFSICGRYCPNCGNGFHLHCFAKWAENDKETSSNVARCPHCFYLIKVPGEVTFAQKMHNAFKIDHKTNSENENNQFYAINNSALNFGDMAVYSACPLCHNIFEEEEIVFKCGNPECNAIYHNNCFNKLEKFPCKVCGSTLKIKLD